MEPERKNSLQVERYDLEILLRRPSLRMSLPRRVSQLPQITSPTDETTCGIGFIRGKWFQSFANRQAYIFVYSILGCFYGSCYAYFYGTITTLEKRFRLSSQTIGMIAVVGDIVQIVISLVLSNLPLKSHRPRWIGLGIYIVVLSTIVSALPHFLYKGGKFFNLNYNHDQNSTLNNNTFISTSCYNETEKCLESTEQSLPVILLLIAQILHGTGGSLFLLLGAGYKEDNLKKYQTPALLSLLSTLKILGPAIGYWLASICLKIFVFPSIVPVTNEDDPRWIGAWWFGFLVIGFMLIIPACLMVLFPSMLPKAAVRKIFGSGKKKPNPKHKSRQFLGTKATLKRLLFSPTFNCNSFAGLFNVMGFMAYFIFLPKYVEIQYGLSASTANFYAGSINLIFSALGVVSAGTLITRNRPRARTLAGWNVFIGILSIGSFFSYIYLGCVENDNQIKTIMSQLSTNNSLNICECDTVPFYPVCDESNKSFFSPCHAGCVEILHSSDRKMHMNCHHSELSTRKIKTVSKGLCSPECHNNLVMFLIATCIISFINGTGRAFNYLFQSKCLEDMKKSIRIDFGTMFLGLLAFIPSPILFGYILDKYCLVWEKDCTGTGHCWFYDNENLRYVINITAMGFVAIRILFDLGVWYCVKNLELYDHIDYFNEENEEG